jgi:BspA type Leucine rich repeat region (6 copies)
MNKIKNLLIIGLGILVFIITGLYVKDHTSPKPETLKDFEFTISGSGMSNECKITGISGYRKEVVIPAQSKDCKIKEVTFGGYRLSDYGSLGYIEAVSFAEDSEIEVIGSFAFSSTRIRTIVLPNSVKVIKNHAFENTFLNSIHIPASVTEIDAAAFEDMYYLEEINVDPNNPNYTSVDGVLFNKNKTHLIKYPSAKKDTRYEVPTGVRVIELFAFTHISSIEELTIPNTVETLGRINNNEHLKSITFKAGSLITSLDLEDDQNSHQGTFERNPSLETIIIPKSVERIGKRTFYLNESLISVQFEEGSQLTIIGGEAFMYTSLSEVTIPKHVEVVDYSAFSNSTLTSVEFEDDSHLKKIGQTAFGNTNIISIQIPKSVEVIEDFAFSDTELETVIFEEGSQIETIHTGIFSNIKLTTITLPDTVTTLNQASFCNLNYRISIVFTSATPPEHVANLFGFSYDITPAPQVKFYVPTESIEAYQASFEGYEVTILGMDQFKE